MSGTNKMNAPSILSGGVFAKKMGANLYIFDISNTGDVSQTLVTTEGGVQRSLQDRFGDVVNVKDFGAKGDGQTDDFSAVNIAVSVAKNNGKALYFPAGTYALGSSLIITDFDNLTIFGDSKSLSIIHSLNPSHVFRVIRCNYVNIYNLGFTHANDNSTSGNTLQIEDCNFCSFRGIEIIDARNDAICPVSTNFTEFRTESPLSRYIEIKDCVINGTRGGAGIRVLRSSDIKVVNNTIQNCTDEAICVDFGAYNAIISGNTFTLNGGAGQISLDGASGTIVSSNRLMSLNGEGVPCIVSNGNLETSYGCVITGNSCYGGAKGIWLKGFSDVTEPILEPPYANGYYGSNRCIVIGNAIRNTPIGIQLEGRSKDNVIYCNTYTNCTRAIKDLSTEVDNWILPERIGIANIGSLVYPSNNSEHLTVPASSATVTATNDGIAEFFYNSSGNKSGWRGIMNTSSGEADRDFKFAAADASSFYRVAVRKGDSIKVEYPSDTSGHALVIRVIGAKKMYASIRAD